MLDEVNKNDETLIQQRQARPAFSARDDACGAAHFAQTGSRTAGWADNAGAMRGKAVVRGWKKRGVEN